VEFLEKAAFLHHNGPHLGLIAAVIRPRLPRAVEFALWSFVTNAAAAAGDQIVSFREFS